MKHKHTWSIVGLFGVSVVGTAMWYSAQIRYLSGPLPTPKPIIRDLTKVLDPYYNLTLNPDEAIVFVPPPSANRLQSFANSTDEYVGPNACAECHEEQLKRASQTAHFHTSAIANSQTVHGPVESGKGFMQTRAKDLEFEIRSTEEKLYQIAKWKSKEAHRAPFDLVFGTGKIAQSYAYWHGNSLLQLPVSYLTASHQWINSPGYADGVADYTRPLINGCLDCHTTASARASDDEANFSYDPSSVIAGVTCERCHGPGKSHVAFHQAYPDSQKPYQILSPNTLSKEELNGVCSQCHGSVVTGDEPQGVHSNNQLERLKKSECFKQSDGISCVACHNPHQNERGNFQLNASRCQKCHDVEDCSDFTEDRRQHFSSHCAECHMEKRKVADVPIKIKEGTIYPEMLDHFIRVLPSKDSKWDQLPLQHASPALEQARGD